ncbi:MAG: bifunctional nuclease family protein [Paludibacter sp.]|nr:bifunctional nuclease family protein [Paludibacter sp.]
MANVSEIKLKIAGLVYNQTIVGTYGLVLAEETGNRRFSVMIGEPEAQSIAMKMNSKKPPRPLTHDLFQSVLKIFDATLEKILICNLVNDIFYSELYIKADNKIYVIDARTSDAVALAVRTNSPIFVKSEILDVVGTEIDSIPEQEKIAEENIDAENMTSEELNLLSIKDLNELLDMAVKEEKYELAVNIRDAIKRKKK